MIQVLPENTGEAVIREYAVSLLRKMVDIHSPTGEEFELALFLKSEMQALGYKVTNDYASNVLGRMGSGDPTILLCGHMDTVPYRLPGFCREGVLYGRGSVDAKGSLAAMISAGKILMNEGFKGSLIVACVVQEEGDNRGVKALIESGIEADYAVFGEPSNGNSLTVGYKGCLTLNIKFKTEPGHSSAPWLYTNAIEKAMEVYFSLKGIVKAMSKASEGFNAITINIREIKGGRNAGLIPDDCSMHVEFRIPPGTDILLLKDHINEQIAQHNIENCELVIEHNYLHSVEPFLTDEKSILIRAFSRTLYKKQRKQVKLIKKSGTSDMNYYGQAYKIPVLSYGPGNPHLSHTNDEHVSIEDYMISIGVLKDSLLYLERLHNKN